MIPRRRFAAIVNPISGRRTTLPLVQQVQRLLELRGSCLQIAVTKAPGHAVELAGRVDSAIDAVLVAGGDGTLGEVINGLGPAPPPLLVFRTGTENLLARELDMPGDPPRAADVLANGTPFRMDVGEVNGRRFLSVAGFGFDAECVERMNRIRRGHITHFDYFWPIWRTFWAHRFPELEIEVDGTPYFQGRGLALVGNIARYSAGMRILRDARIDDGLLDLGIFPCASKTRLLAHAGRALAGRHIGRRGLIYKTFRTLEIRSLDRVPVELDGELGGLLPARCHVIPGGLTFLQ